MSLVSKNIAHKTSHDAKRNRTITAAGDITQIKHKRGCVLELCKRLVKGLHSLLLAE